MKKGHKRQSHEKRVDLAGEYRWGDAGQITLLLIFIVFTCLDVFYLKIAIPYLDLITFYIQIIIAIPILIISGYLAKSGLNIVFGQERSKLMVIRSGVFSRVRHPIYLGSILLFLGFSILFMSVVSFIIWIIIIIFYVYLSKYEEQILIDSLGDEYRKYIHDVPMFIPRIRKR